MSANATFSLIKSLTTNEKRYLRRNFTDSQKNTSYTQLFDLLDKQKTYLPKELKLNYKTSNLSADCKYLFELILEYLMRLHVTTNNALFLNNVYQKVILLADKKLYKEAEKKCLNAQNVFDEIANPIHQLLFSHFITNYLNSELNFSKADDLQKIESNYELAKIQINNIEVVIELKRAYDLLMMSSHFKVPFEIGSKEIKQLTKKLISKHFTNKLYKCDKHTQVMYSRILFSFYQKANDAKKMLLHAKNGYEIVRNNTEMHTTKIGISAVKQMLASMAITQDSKGFFTVWHEIESQFKNGEDILNRNFQLLVFLSVQIKIEGHGEVFNLMKKRAKQALPKLKPRGLMMTYYCFCLLYFHKKLFSDFLFYYTKLRSISSYDSYKIFLAPTLIIIEIMRMIIYVVTDDFKALQYAILDFKDQPEIINEHSYVSNYALSLFENILASPKNKNALLQQFSKWYNNATETRLAIFRGIYEFSDNLEKEG